MDWKLTLILTSSFSGGCDVTSRGGAGLVGKGDEEPSARRPGRRREGEAYVDGDGLNLERLSSGPSDSRLARNDLPNEVGARRLARLRDEGDKSRTGELTLPTVDILGYKRASLEEEWVEGGRGPRGQIARQAGFALSAPPGKRPADPKWRQNSIGAPLHPPLRATKERGKEGDEEGGRGKVIRVYDGSGGAFPRRFDGVEDSSPIFNIAQQRRHLRLDGNRPSIPTALALPPTASAPTSASSPASPTSTLPALLVPVDRSASWERRGQYKRAGRERE